jgi:hypothetical protein
MIYSPAECPYVGEALAEMLANDQISVLSELGMLLPLRTASLESPAEARSSAGRFRFKVWVPGILFVPVSAWRRFRP